MGTPYLRETWSNRVPHGLKILTKFHEDRAKNVDLLLKAHFLMCAIFLNQSLFNPDYIQSLNFQASFQE